MKGYLLLFNPAENIILTIYFNRDAETLEEEVYDCRDEVNILSLLLRDELIGSGVTVAGIVYVLRQMYIYVAIVKTLLFLTTYLILLSILIISGIAISQQIKIDP